MSDFVPTDQTDQASIPDPNKHVRYSYGMVLGKEDLEQDFAFHHGRDLWGMREVIGYGTVRGLAVKVEDDGVQGPRVSVMPGTAITPRGELVCVPTEQCASLNDWLKKQAGDATKRTLLEGKIASNQLKLYVTLCYRDCPTDDLPIPGEPCRDEADAMAPSRLTDDFALELHLEPPDQLEEESGRDFVTWLRAIPLEAGAPDTLEALDAFADAVRNAFTVDTTMVPPEVAFNSPPAPPALPKIPSSNSKEFYRTAFRVWVTEIRPRQDGLGQFINAIREVLSHSTTDDTKAVLPTSEKVNETRFIEAIKRAAGLSRDHTTPGLMDVHEFDGLLFSAKPASLPEYWQDAWTVWDQVLQRWMARSAQCAWPPEESCVLLSRLEVPLTAADANNERRVDGNATAVRVSEESRPYLAHLRILQEWMLSDVNLPGGAPPALVLDGDVIDAPSANKVVKIQNIPVSPTAPTTNQILQFNGTNWAPAAPPAGGGAPVTLAGDVTGNPGTNQLAKIQGKTVNAPTPAANQVLQFNGTNWVAATLPAGPGVPPAVTLAGDVTGNPGTNQLAKIQGKTVNAPTPAANQVLQFNGSNWVAATLPPPVVPPVTLAGDVLGAPGSNQIDKIQGKTVNAPTPAANQVLQFNGTNWVAATLPSSAATDVVQKPKGLPDYFIVAAGRVRGDGAAIGPVFNELAMSNTGQAGVGLLKFRRYKVPDASFQYIVKAIACSSEIQDLTVIFMDFVPDGILMGVTLNGRPFENFKAIELMVEISMFLK